MDNRAPKGRGKRGRASAGTPVNEKLTLEGRKLRKCRRGNSTNGFQAPPSPARSDVSVGGGVKRKGRPLDLDLSDNAKVKRCRSSSRGVPGTESPSSGLIECPEPKCNKKYKHINGLRYHQTHAHQNSTLSSNQDDDDNDDADVADSEPPPAPVASTREKRKCTIQNDSEEKAKTKDKEVAKSLSVKDKENEDNIPLKEIAEASKAVSSSAAAAAAASSSIQQDKPVKSDAGKSDSKSENSTASTPKKSEAPPVTSSASTSVSTPLKSCSVPVTQIYQITSAPMGCLGGVAVVTQAVSTIVSSPASTSTNSSVANPIPITVTAITSGPQPPTDLTKSDPVKEKGEKCKNKTANRPIVPAPSPQMIALSSNVNVTHSNLSPVTTHSQMSPSLKPIQPKPTIMGEPHSINPALVGLKDKKPKQKKKKDKDNVHININTNKQPTKDQVLKDDHSKSERPAVIKSTPVPSRPTENTSRKDVKELNVPTIELPKTTPSEVQRPSSRGPSVITSQVSNKGGDSMQQRQAQPPSLLKVNSPLVSTPDRKTPLTDDVQSPAYSDISDANESCSPQQSESPQKKEPSSAKKEDQPSGPQLTQEEGSNVSHYGMYYYGQAPYMMSNVPASHPSPNSSKSQTPSKEPAASTSSSSSSDDKKPVSSAAEDGRKPETKGEDKGDGKSNQPEGHQGQQAMTPQQLQEYEMQRQKWLQQMYAHLQHLPPQAQYQYLAAYGYIDPQYMMQQDPHYRQQYEKAAEEHRRREQEQGGKEGEGSSSKKSDSRPASRDHGTPSSEPQPAASKILKQPSLPPPSQGSNSSASIDRIVENKKPLSIERPSERDFKDQALREKQNENHQILKENIELKSQMERSQMERSRYDMHPDYSKIYKEKQQQQQQQQEEARRNHMFQQQKYLEQQKRMREISASKPPELTSTESSVKIRPGSEVVKFDNQPRDLVKKETVDIRQKDIHGREGGSVAKNSSELKNLDEKPRIGDKPRTPVDPGKVRTPQQMPQSSGSVPSAAGNVPPSATVATGSPAGAAAGVSAPYSPYMSYPPYMQSATHYGHMPYDPNSSMGYRMNQQVIGYGNNPSYLHPAHMGYRIGSGEGEKEKADPKTVVPVPVPQEPEAKSVEGSGPPYYSNVHKIHELGDKTRVQAHSPVTTKSLESSPSVPVHPVTSSAADKSRDFSSSPPTQRHVHTHHHTHVVGGFPSMYEPMYGAPLIAPHASPSSLPHNYNK